MVRSVVHGSVHCKTHQSRVTGDDDNDDDDDNNNNNSTCTYSEAIPVFISFPTSDCREIPSPSSRHTSDTGHANIHSRGGRLRVKKRNLGFPNDVAHSMSYRGLTT
jgi:hypothetical protein